MKPFDLKAAKRGEPVIDIPSGCPVHFVGTTRDGDCIVELVYTAGLVKRTKNELCIAGLVKRTKNELCMAPKKRTVWVWFDEFDFVCACTDKYIESMKQDNPSFNFTKVEIEE